MRKDINVKPVTELVLNFEDGKSITLIFDMRSLLNINDLEGGIAALFKDSSLTGLCALPELCAKVIYIGAKEEQKDFTLEEARILVSNMDLMSINEVMSEFNMSMGVVNNEVQGETQKKLMMQFLQTLQ